MRTVSRACIGNPFASGSSVGCWARLSSADRQHVNGTLTDRTARCRHPEFKRSENRTWPRGYLDGVEGLTIAYMAALYNFLKYVKAINMSSRR